MRGRAEWKEGKEGKLGMERRAEVPRLFVSSPAEAELILPGLSGMHSKCGETGCSYGDMYGNQFYLYHFYHDRQFYVQCILSTTSNINKVVPTQRTRALVTALEPPEQTHRMERVLTRRAALVRRLHVRRDDTVADSALALALERPLHVLPEC